QITGGVAVVANNTWRAFQAANALDIEWEPAPYPLEQPEHWAALEAAFTENRLDSRNKDEGDVDTALAEATEVIEAEYRAPYVAHQPLEPITATVQYERRNVQVWTGTQIPRFVQRNVAKLLGEEPEDVHVNVQMMGGSFGHRLEDAVVQQAAEIARELPGVPVKLTYSREEDFAQDFLRQISIARLKGTVKDGKVETMDLSVASPGIIASQMGRQGFPTMGPDMALPAGGADQPFAIPNSRFSVYLADQLAPVSSWRSVGASTNGFFHDSALDELIHAAGADPMEERIRLCWHEGSRGVLEAVAEMCSWSGPSPEPGKGRGVAFTLSFGVPTAEVVEVTNTEEGVRIDKVWVAVEVGRVLDPVNFENLVQGGVIWGLGHAMNCEITHTGGAADQLNFHAHEGMRLYQCPEIEVRGLETASKIRGIGEPPTPPAAPALGNAIFAATGMRLREMPFNKGARFI
ncbi:MAG: molybdopterin cofactor-binding domain-containing protein, partial [Pseudomonadota bacterium]